jgi:hypothetical protein
MNPKIRIALEILAHYHLDHTQDKVTRFVNSKDDSVPAVYVISDPAMKRAVAEFLKAEFPQTVVVSEKVKQ